MPLPRRKKGATAPAAFLCSPCLTGLPRLAPDRLPQVDFSGSVPPPAHGGPRAASSVLRRRALIARRPAREGACSLGYCLTGTLVGHLSTYQVLHSRERQVPSCNLAQPAHETWKSRHEAQPVTQNCRWTIPVPSGMNARLVIRLRLAHDRVSTQPTLPSCSLCQRQRRRRPPPTRDVSVDMARRDQVPIRTR